MSHTGCLPGPFVFGDGSSVDSCEVCHALVMNVTRQHKWFTMILSESPARNSSWSPVRHFFACGRPMRAFFISRQRVLAPLAYKRQPHKLCSVGKSGVVCLSPSIFKSNDVLFRHQCRVCCFCLHGVRIFFGGVAPWKRISCGCATCQQLPCQLSDPSVSNLSSLWPHSVLAHPPHAAGGA